MIPTCSDPRCASCRAALDQQRQRDDLVDRVARRGLALGFVAGILVGLVVGLVLAVAARMP